MFNTEWNLIKEAYSGTGGFSDGSYIAKYPRESDDKIKQRQDIAYYPNIIASKVKRYIGYLFKKSAIRNTDNEILKSIIDDVDRKGNHIDIFMQNFTLESKLRGCNLLLVDNVSSFSANYAEQKNNREFPYFVSIPPESVSEYKLDKYGNFEYIAYSDVIDNSTFGNKDVVSVTRYYDTQKWIVYEGDKVIESGEHNLGICPILYLSESGVFPSIGEFTQLGGIAKRYYNLKSELDEILRSQTFSILAIQAKDKAPNISLGTNNALLYDSDKEPAFITPSNVPTTAYQNEIDSIIELIDRITYDINTNQNQESGIALDIKFQGLNSSLSSFARKCEDFEIRAFDIVCRYLGINLDISISYPKEFNIIDTHKEIETLSMIKAIRDIPSYERLKLQTIIKNDLNNVNDDDFEVIDKELEDGQKMD
jgi:hypothetical protein